MSVLKNSVLLLLVGAVASASAVLTAGSAIAQSPPASDIEGFGTGTDDNGSDMFGDTSDPYELIHRAILSPSMSSDEYQQYQQRAITSEADAFRLRQQEALRQTQDLEAVETEPAAVEEESL